MIGSAGNGFVETGETPGPASVGVGGITSVLAAELAPSDA